MKGLNSQVESKRAKGKRSLSIVTMVLIGTMLVLGSDAAVPAKGHCAACSAAPCVRASSCGHGCVCLIKGGQSRGECYQIR